MKASIFQNSLKKCKVSQTVVRSGALQSNKRSNTPKAPKPKAQRAKAKANPLFAHGPAGLKLHVFSMTFSVFMALLPLPQYLERTESFHIASQFLAKGDQSRGFGQSFSILLQQCQRCLRSWGQMVCLRFLLHPGNGAISAESLPGSLQQACLQEALMDNAAAVTSAGL